MITTGGNQVSLGILALVVCTAAVEAAGGSVIPLFLSIHLACLYFTITVSCSCSSPVTRFSLLFSLLPLTPLFILPPSFSLLLWCWKELNYPVMSKSPGETPWCSRIQAAVYWQCTVCVKYWSIMSLSSTTFFLNKKWDIVSVHLRYVLLCCQHENY